ncbi:tetratricopeptide repeat protein [Paracidovorax wautersii]|uniref:Tetratricopeptide (TPR) repeat protein n=1 Tax=Paracidovorax wautersii TaxID=1177982 RepID=A0ABU1I5J0_9BURK|nr:tetratricopeptide repeat protein [Paracidovorax wautersii]MDR6212490.1 tetratricopeptide (TPR) repeat protein [Paracidovorax wautersii]
MDYYGSMVQSHRFKAIALACMLALSAGAVQAQSQPPEPIQAAPAETDDDPSSSDARAALDAELFYEILLGEMTSSTGDPGTGYALMLEAARRSRDGQLYRRATDIALQSRSAEYALIAAKAWKEALPQSREANRYVLQILIALNRIGETPELLQRELAQSTVRARIATIQALPPLYGRASDKKLAAAVVEQALANELTHPAVGPTAWTTIGRMRLVADDKPGALEAVKQAQALEAGNDGAALLSMLLVEQGVSQAEPLLARYLAGSPLPEIRMAYARTLIETQRLNDAQAQVDAVTREKPDLPEAWLVQASLHLQAQRLVEAQASLQQFQSLVEPLPAGDPRRSALSQAYLMQAQIAEKQGNFAQAETWLSRIDNTADLFSAQTRRASLLARQGKLAEAQTLIRGLPAATPEDERTKLLAEVQLLRDAQKHQEAFDLQSRVVALKPQDNDLVYDQAMLAEKAGKLDVMEKLLREIIARQPDYHHAYNALGYSLAERGVRLPEARQLITKALELAPGDPFITDSLAWVEFRLGNAAEAARLLEEAFKKQPDAEIAAHWGEVLWTLGQRERANAVWRDGLKINRDNGTLKDTLKRLGANP